MIGVEVILDLLQRPLQRREEVGRSGDESRIGVRNGEGYALIVARRARRCTR
jgi:hypothetical protein